MLAPIERSITNMKEKAHVSANKSGSLFLAMFFLQFAATQYGTYVAFSWDIMEPICCAMSLADAGVAYSFWVWSGKPYDIDGLKNFYFERKLRKLLRRENIDYHVYQSLKQRKAEILDKLKQNA